jgi:hypothetical protein
MSKPTGELSKEEIEKLKLENGGELWLLTFGENEAVCYLKKPSRITLDAFFANAKTPLKGVEIFIKNCFVAGDETFKSDTAKMLSAGEQIEEIIGTKKTSLQKL